MLRYLQFFIGRSRPLIISAGPKSFCAHSFRLLWVGSYLFVCDPKSDGGCYLFFYYLIWFFPLSCRTVTWTDLTFLKRTHYLPSRTELSFGTSRVPSFLSFLNFNRLALSCPGPSIVVAFWVFLFCVLIPPSPPPPDHRGEERQRKKSGKKAGKKDGLFSFCRRLICHHFNSLIRPRQPTRCRHPILLRNVKKRTKVNLPSVTRSSPQFARDSTLRNKSRGIMEGLLLCPPDRSALIGRAAWKVNSLATYH